MLNRTAQLQEVKDNSIDSPGQLFLFFLLLFSCCILVQAYHKQATKALYKLRENKKGQLIINSPCTNQWPEL